MEGKYEEAAARKGSVKKVRREFQIGRGEVHREEKMGNIIRNRSINLWLYQ